MTRSPSRRQRPKGCTMLRPRADWSVPAAKRPSPCRNGSRPGLSPTPAHSRTAGYRCIRVRPAPSTQPSDPILVVLSPSLRTPIKPHKLSIAAISDVCTHRRKSEHCHPAAHHTFFITNRQILYRIKCIREYARKHIHSAAASVHQNFVKIPIAAGPSCN